MQAATELYALSSSSMAIYPIYVLDGDVVVMVTLMVLRRVLRWRAKLRGPAKAIR